MYNKINGYPFRSSYNSGRMWGMSHSLPSGMFQYAGQHSPIPDHYYNNPPYSQPPSLAHHHHHQLHLQDSDFPPHMAYWATGGGGGSGGGASPHHHSSHYPSAAAAVGYSSRRGSSSVMGGYSSNGYGGAYSGGPQSHLAGHFSSASTSSLTGLGLNSGGCGSGSETTSTTTNLIVNSLPQDMTERELYSLFVTMGPIESCRVMRDLKTGYSYGFGFVNFISDESALRAIKCLNGLTIRNKRIKVSYARPAGDEAAETNLYVSNLPKTVTEELLDVIFGKYGTILQKNILRDKLTGQPRGVAFIRFNKREEAQEAVSALNNVIPQGGSQPLTVRVADDQNKAKTSMSGYVPAYNSAVHRGVDNYYNSGRKKSFPYTY